MTAAPGGLRARVGPLSDTLACLRAMRYVKLRFLLRRLRGIGGKPWAPAVILLVIAAAAVGQTLLLRQGGGGAGAAGEAADVVGAVLRVAALALPMMLAASTRVSPLQLTVAEASWLLTAPGGDRAVLVRRLLFRPVAVPLLLLAFGSVARLAQGLPLAGVWTAPVVMAVIVLTIGLSLCAGHVVTARSVGAQQALRKGALVWGTLMLAELAFGVPGGSWVLLEPVTERMAIALTVPDEASAGWLLGILVGQLTAAAVLIATASGFLEAADNRARQAAHVQETLRRSRSGQELGGGRFRSGVPSLRARPGLGRERALVYRALAQERRGFRDNLKVPFNGLVMMVVLLAFAPDFVWAPLLLVVANLAFLNSLDGLAVELDHYHFRLAGLRPWPTLLWVNVVPVARTMLAFALLWGVLAASPSVDARMWVVGAVLIPPVSALFVAAGTLAATVVDVMGARLLTVLGGTGVGVVPAGVALWPVLQGEGSVLRAIVACAWLVGVAACWLAITRRAVWPVGAREETTVTRD